MAISGKYGRLSIPGIDEDEPVFILRAQDKLAEFAIQMYQSLVASHDSPVMRSIQVEIDKFHSWSGKKKIPD